MSDPSGKPIVYIVDDEEHITELVAIGLGINGFAPTRIHSAREALRLVEAARPDLMILDVMIPDLDGFEVGRRMPGRGGRHRDRHHLPDGAGRHLGKGAGPEARRALAAQGL